MQLSVLWSRRFLTNPLILWLLFICNLLGTIYGYIWYGSQLQDTVNNYPVWLVVFVPDSPTASLFFTLSILFLLLEHRFVKWLKIRMLIEALGVVTSIKYGIWAVAMIFAGAYQGGTLAWQDYMLTASHLAMAAEALLYVRFFRCGTWMILCAAAWTFLNDTVDYSFGVYPWLPDQLDDNVTEVQNFTFLLTLFSSALSWISVRLSGRE
ncbi:DUF1405 domain-containing protein [Paenibacillus caui]|uniref:DUF1405 domain-containing protein n=1 Tax=Paenibacillus caui TaxID=2873927 RepID=UPI001CA8CC37|nr:DUF1405 domain-containing protein [Paenibacillus caui]